MLQTFAQHGFGRLRIGDLGVFALGGDRIDLLAQVFVQEGTDLALRGDRWQRAGDQG
jgi:hypothetical protein